MSMYQRGVCPQVEARCVEGQRAWEGMERDLQLLRDEVDDRYTFNWNVMSVHWTGSDFSLISCIELESDLAVRFRMCQAPSDTRMFVCVCLCVCFVFVCCVPGIAVWWG